MRSCCFILSLASVGGAASHGAESNLFNELPAIHVKLAPPARPYPMVDATIRSLESSRKASEVHLDEELEHSYSTALAGAKVILQDVIDSALNRKAGSVGFVQTSSAAATKSQDYTVKVNLYSSEQPSLRGLANLRRGERKRAQAERALFQQAVREMSALTQIAARELRVRIVELLGKRQGGAVAFTSTAEKTRQAPQGLPDVAKVRIEASGDGWPTVSDLIQQMERRRDAAESVVRDRILEVELRLLKAENEFIEDALAHIARQMK